MNRFTAAVLSLMELLEAEGREFRSQAEAAARRMLFLFFGALCFFAAALFAAFAFFVFAAPVIGGALATAILALMLATAGHLLMRISTHQSKQTEVVAEEDKEHGDVE